MITVGDTVYDESGMQIQLGPKIGWGGEAAIYEIDGTRDLCAKIFYTPTQERHTKVLVMIANPPADPMQGRHRWIAWPISSLYRNQAKTDFAGFTMPVVCDGKTILRYYDPGYRIDLHGGKFNWKYLLTTARNLASAIAAINKKHYCVADINTQNILVFPSTFVTLIDCDSFQIRDQSGKIHRCPVGTGEYTPPELQGKPFSSIDRRRESDSFGLGVLVFQLLMQGFHPYQGKWNISVKDELRTPEGRIKEGKFPYGTTLSDFSPHPRAPDFEMLHPDLRPLFHRCFVDGHHDPIKRPKAQEWYEVLDSLLKELKQCRKTYLPSWAPDFLKRFFSFRNKNHFYFNHLAECPWCKIRNETGKDPFPRRRFLLWFKAILLWFKAKGKKATPKRTPAAGIQTPLPAVDKRISDQIRKWLLRLPSTIKKTPVWFLAPLLVLALLGIILLRSERISGSNVKTRSCAEILAKARSAYDQDPNSEFLLDAALTRYNEIIEGKYGDKACIDNAEQGIIDIKTRYVELGNKQKARGDYQKALSLYDKARKIDPGDQDLRSKWVDCKAMTER